MRKVPKAVLRRLIALMVVSFPFVGSSFTPSKPDVPSVAKGALCEKVAEKLKSGRIVSSSGNKQRRPPCD